jgi:diguanylate cyclase (GGDEF)-like protein/PAS domain S-box-containing protein
MMRFMIRPLQWGAGGYCAFSGLLMLVTPHQFLSPGYAALQAHLGLWGLLFLLAGSFMLGVALLNVPRRVMIVAHLLTGAALLLLAAGFVTSQLWSGTINLSVLGLGTLLAALPAGATPRDPRQSAGDLLALLVGLGMSGNGLLMLLMPAQYNAPLYGPIRSLLPEFGLAFALSGALLAFQQLRPTTHRAPLVRWIVHLLGAAVLSSLLPVVILGQIWSGIPYYGVIAVLIALNPGRDRIRWRIDGGALRTRLALAMALVAAVPLILMTAWFSGQSEQQTRAVALADMQTLAAALASSVGSYAAGHRNAVLTLAANPGLMALAPAAQRTLLQEAARAYPDIVAFSTYDATGQPLVRSDNLPPTKMAPTVLTTIQGARGPVNMVIMSPLLHRPIFVFAAPSTRMDGTLDGIVLVAVESARVADSLKQSITVAGGLIYLVDSTGRVIAHPDTALVAGFTNLGDTPPVAAFLARPDGSGALSYGAPATQQLAGYAPVPGLGWGVIVEQPVATALAATRHAREQWLILVLLFLTAAALTGVLVARGMAAPLSDLVAATTALAGNEQEAPLPAASGIHELDRLAVVFGIMRERVAGRTAELTAANSTLLHEITLRAQIEEVLRESEQRYSSVIASLEEGIALQAADGSILAINGSAERILAVAGDQMLGLKSFYTHLRVIHEDGTPFTYEEDPTAITLRTGLPCSHVIIGIYHTDERVAWLNINSQPLLRPGETQPYAVVSSLTDITERKQAEEALHELATRDALTGLRNRREMLRILDEETARFQRYGHLVSLLMIDVDHFKNVNDRYGHQVGDEVLQWLAQHFQQSLRDTDRAVRYGGEEFAIILSDTAAVTALQVAERLRGSIAARPFTTRRAEGGAIEIPLTISVGLTTIARISDTGATAAALIAAADQALYQAKQSGRNRTMSFTLRATEPAVTREKVGNRPMIPDRSRA